MMPEDDSKSDAHSHSKAWAWRVEASVAAAEACGTALLVLVTGLAPAAAAAASAGAAVAMLVQCFDHISGAMFNPTVVVAALVRGRVSPRRAGCMLAAQLAGAAAGAGALAALAAPAAAHVTLPARGLAAPLAACLEAAGGACLALANCAAWDDRNAALRDSWPLRIGTCVAALTYALGERTGASMNPARSFGPALLACRWQHHWVYWVGPLGGSLAAAALYAAVWGAPGLPRPRQGR